MRSRVLVLCFIALGMTAARPAFAEDAGDAGTSEAGAVGADGGCGAAGADEAGVCCDEGGACGVAEAGGIVVACDGGLCDTLQGRPTCDVAASSIGWSPVDVAPLGGAAVAVGLGIVRRRRGAARPGSGG